MCHCWFFRLLHWDSTIPTRLCGLRRCRRHSQSGVYQSPVPPRRRADRPTHNTTGPGDPPARFVADRCYAAIW